jgi:hypothetical protein
MIMAEQIIGPPPRGNYPHRDDFSDRAGARDKIHAFHRASDDFHNAARIPIVGKTIP